MLLFVFFARYNLLFNFPMKKSILLWFYFIASLPFLSFAQQHSADTVSIVYFTRNITPEGMMKAFAKIENRVQGKVGVKVHFGEEGNTNFINPALVKPITDKFNANLVETNVLYVSKRRYTASHIQLAKDHGFTFAPIDILDSEGDTIIPCQTENYRQVKVGKHVFDYQTLIIVSHFKGHGSAGFGGAIKNVSMGLASIAGKMAMHASAIPTVKTEKCTKCGHCVPLCPAGAITIEPYVRIDSSKCIGCGKCIGECPDGVYGVPWRSTELSVFHKRLVEYAYVICQNRNMLYVNVLANISKSCDCARNAPKPFVGDIGILVSTDIVAIEAASHALVNKAAGCDDAFFRENGVSGADQIEYAWKLKMGNKSYIVIDLDK